MAFRDSDREVPQLFFARDKGKAHLLKQGKHQSQLRAAALGMGVSNTREYKTLL